MYFSSILILFYNSISILNQKLVNKSQLYEIVSSVFLSFAITLFLLLLVVFSQKLLKATSSLFLIISSSTSYFTYKYKTLFDETMINNLFDTTPNEFHDFFSIIPFLLIFIFAVLPIVFIYKYINFQPITNKSYKSYKSIIIILVLCLLASFITKRDLLEGYTTTSKNDRYISYLGLPSPGKLAVSHYAPINIILGIAKVTGDKISTLFINKKDIFKQYPFYFKNNLTDQPLTIVLVIGESARVQNQHYYGYFRNTNTYTEKIKNIVYFKDMQSCGTATNISVPCMLSRRYMDNYRKYPYTTETNLIDVFKKLNFKTWWISNQDIDTQWHDQQIRENAYQASQVFWSTDLQTNNNVTSKYIEDLSNNYDSAIFNTFDYALESKNFHKLIVVQLHGSHYDYSLRTPQNFKVFTTNCGNKQCSNGIIYRDYYDNSLLYSDYILSVLIKKLENKNALLLYVSDHGDSLELDNSGFFGHSTPYSIAPKEQTRVTSLMWISNSLQKLLPHALDNVKQHSNLHISQDYIFNSLFGCLNITSTVVNSKFNLCAAPNVRVK
ncbi:phosphoethanolamine transferase [Rickettsiales bacterium LUAb2]